MAYLHKCIYKFWAKYMQPADLMALMVCIELIKGLGMISIDYFRDFDYSSYTEQVKIFVDGERDITKLVGK